MKTRFTYAIEAAGFISIATSAFAIDTKLGFLVLGVLAVLYAQGIK